MKRLTNLEERRRELLARCEAQREEIAWRIGQLGPRRWAQSLASGAASGAVGALRSLRRPRDALFLLARARGALGLAARATEVLGVVSALRRKKRSPDR